MSRIETEARELLLQRRRVLQRDAPVASAEVATMDDVVAGGVFTERVAREISRIDEALGRIAVGRYGACLSCGGPLGLQRIRAIPEARYCLGCSGSRPIED